jgi:uncharacterized protein (TIGR02466 family)
VIAHLEGLPVDERTFEEHHRTQERRLSSNTPLPGAELIELFPSRMLKYQWPESEELNAQLRAAILARMAADPGQKKGKTNVGGWHSENTLQHWPEPCFKELLGWIDVAVRTLVLWTVNDAPKELFEGWDKEAWANVNRYGHYNRSHDHTLRGTLWSGIYYVEPGGGADPAAVGGLTQFEDSNAPAIKGADGRPVLWEFAVQPCAGQMVLFPSTLRHRVDPYLGHDLRITVAFNLRHPGFAPPAIAAQQGWMWRNFRGVMLARDEARRLAGGVLGRE